MKTFWKVFFGLGFVLATYNTVDMFTSTMISLHIVYMNQVFLNLFVGLVFLGALFKEKASDKSE